MDTLAHARLLATQGRFAQSLAYLDQLPAVRVKNAEAEILRAELLERVGHYDEAEQVVRRMLRNRSLGDSLRSACEFVLAMVLSERGNTDGSCECLQMAIESAERASDIWRSCWARLRLFVSEHGRSAALPGSSSFQELRRNIVCLGDPFVSAAMHVFLGEIEAKRGLASSSYKHTMLGKSLLAQTGNIWLEALAENSLAALAIIRFDLEEGYARAQRAIELSEESGATAAKRAALANLGNVHLLRGTLAFSRELFESSYRLSPTSGEHANGVLDNLAKVFLAEGRTSEVEGLLRKIESSLKSERDRQLFSNRHSLLTRVELLMIQSQWSKARSVVDLALGIATAVEDRELQGIALSRKARIVAQMGDETEAGRCIRKLGELMVGDCSPSHHIRYELALRSAAHATTPNTNMHALRAETMCNTTGCSGGFLQYELNLENEEPKIAESRRSDTSAPNLQDFAALLLHAGRPELLATGLLAILRATPGIAGARAIARAADGTAQDLDSCGQPVDEARARTFQLGTARGCAIELQVDAPLDPESQATLNSVGFIVAATLELERGRIEREERQTLWPADELPAVGDDSVVAGKMRDVMLYARKVAQANVTVLITGESGTGKEVLARAIHRYSARSKKPFIPFNCTAVPRELLESHLFGFKRGAFTGADRDNPGLIRAAKDGTLFLDEIGELGLDLQPKLLRFLESSEIHPLGEPSPFSVNVRIVAATNADLQKLVAEGKFREDLYYRLNVIPMALPPLRERREEIAPLAQHFALKWSHELGKGRMRVSDALMEHLVLYPWPGNIRQLSNEIHRMVAFADAGSPLTVDHMPPALRAETELLKRRARGLEMALPLDDRLEHAVSTLEREMIKVALRSNNGKVEPAAKALGISRKGLYLKRQRFGL